MVKVKFSINIGYGVHEDETEYEGNPTDEQLEEDYKEWKNGIVDGYWERI